MNESIIIISGIAIILIIVLVLVKKISNKIKDIALKVDFFDQKLDAENEKVLAKMNQQYTDVLTSLKGINEKINPEADMDDTELYEQAKEIIEEHGICSASLLQRTLRIGYARAARLIDLLEENGVVGPGDGAKPREVIEQDQPEESESS